jgi:hypothetical protein
MHSRAVAIGVAVLVAGAVLRALAIGQDLWLDEIWSLQVAGGMASALDAFRLTLDNNHVLITLWMYALGGAHGAVLYRLPSLVAGLCTIATAWWIGWRKDASRAWLYAAVFAASFPLTVYAVEARGYAVALACALGIYALFVGETWPSGKRILAIGALALLGFTAHFAFAQFYLAFGLWSLLRAARALPNRPAQLRGLIVLHAAPGAYACLLYAALVKNLHSAGGAQAPYPAVLAETLNWALGLPAVLGLWALLGAALIVLVSDARARRREGADEWGFLLLITIAPVLITLLVQPRLVVPRYFLLGVVFFLLPLCAAIARLHARSQPLGALAFLVVAAVNLQQTASFLEHGRGHYADAVRYLGAHTQGAEVVVGSDHDVRNARVLAYYSALLAPAQRIVYIKHADRAPAAPQWLIMHAFGQPPAPRAAFALKSGAAYRLRKTFPYAGPSGFHWFVYEHVASTAVPPM